MHAVHVSTCRREPEMRKRAAVPHMAAQFCVSFGFKSEWDSSSMKPRELSM